MSLPAYPEYEDSGVPWLGMVPRHWEITRFKRLVEIQNGADYKHIEQEDGYPVIGSGGPFTFASHYIYDGESVLLGRKGTIDKPLHVWGRFWTVDTMYWTKIRQGVSGRFAYYTALTIPFSYYSTSTALPSMTQGALNSHAVALPCEAEQQAVVAFLDHETSKIDALVAEQQRLMELLTEEMISLALPPAGSARTREIRLENVAYIISRPVVQREGEIYTPIGLFNRGRGVFHKDPREMDDMGDSDFFWIEDGDLIVSGQFAWEGAIALADKEDTGCVVSHRYPVLRGKPGIALTEYLFAFLSTKHGDFLLNENSRGAAGRNRPLNINSLLKEKISLPDLHTQERVARAVHLRSALFTEIVEQIELLQERRTALISAAVTGKIDVRGLAPAKAEAA